MTPPRYVLAMILFDATVLAIAWIASFAAAAGSSSTLKTAGPEQFDDHQVRCRERSGELKRQAGQNIPRVIVMGTWTGG